jgi:hypothetical protein
MHMPESNGESNAATNTKRPKRILIARHPTYKGGFYDCVFKWLMENYPHLLQFFQIVEFPAVFEDWSDIILHVPWLQDPVQGWCKKTYAWAIYMMAECDRHKIPVINRVDRLTNATKFAGARAMRSVGIATPKMALIKNAEEFRETLLDIPLPLFVREDWGHWGKIYRADTLEAARAIPIEEFARPLAVEIIDVRDPTDGLYRKYRYIAAGDVGISHHVQISSEWITRGDNRVYSEVTRDDELAYIAKPDPHHELFQRAAKAMGLEFVAFDYAYDHSGRMVTWEANPFPLIHFSKKKLMYRNHAIRRTMCAMVALYFEQAGLPVPERMAQGLTYAQSTFSAT